MILALRYRAVWLGAIVCMALAIAFGSLSTAAIVRVLAVWDKLQHGGAYFLLAGLCLGVVERRAYPFAAVAAVAFGGLLEVAQGTLTVSRVMEWRDLLANTMGISFALGLAYAGLGGWAQRVERMLGVRG